MAKQANRKKRRAISRAFLPIKALCESQDIEWRYHSGYSGAFKTRISKPNGKSTCGVEYNVSNFNSVTVRMDSKGRQRVYINWQADITETQMRETIAELLMLGHEKKQITVLK